MRACTQTAMAPGAEAELCQQARFSRLGIYTLLALIIGAVLAPHFGVLAEDAQTFLFPLFAVVFYFIPKNRAQRLPLVLLLFVVLLWLATSAFVRGALPQGAETSRIYLSRLQGDSDGMQARGLYQRINEIARTYELPRMELVQRFFSDEADALQWLHRNPRSPFVIWGAPEWYTVSLAPNQSDLLSPHKLDGSCPTETKGERFDNNSFCIPPFGGRFELVLVPESITIPDTPPELGRHFIAWLARGLSLDKKPGHPWNRSDKASKPVSQSALLLAMRRDAVIEALRIDGPWASGTPHGLAHFLLGTLDCIEGLEQGAPEERLFESSLEHFRKAASLVAETDNPRLFAAIFNNAALVKLLLARGEDDVRQARKWFALAADSASGGRGTRYALKNISQLY